MFPSGFAKWCEDDSKELSQQDRYKKRIKDHLDQLKISSEVRRPELSNTYLAEELINMESKAELMEGSVGSKYIEKTNYFYGGCSNGRSINHYCESWVQTFREQLKSLLAPKVAWYVQEIRGKIRLLVKEDGKTQTFIRNNLID